MPQPSQTVSLKRLLTAPTRLFARSEVLRKPSPVPSTNGCSAWYFREVPKIVPIRGCVTFEGKTLLHIGVAPDKQDKLDSRQTLRSRIKRHYRGDAKGSTLRRTLGVLLEPQSGFPLRRVGSGSRITLTPAGEGYLNQWMEENAFVVWGEHPEPWTIEHDLLHEISCPLNIKDNEQHPFVATLKAMRAEALRRAREKPIANE
jgi:GIY-YIG catalytic domain